MNYYEKYLKYKSKYLSLKKDIFLNNSKYMKGGMNTPNQTIVINPNNICL